MANTKRRMLDNKGRTFIPMNVEGGVYETSFLNSAKVAIIIVTIIAYIIAWANINNLNSGWVLKLVLHLIVIWFLGYVIIRLHVLEENYYYDIYCKMKETSVTTPACFWSIADIRDTEDGAIITYSDMRTAVILKFERDTVTGKQEEFKEIHYDALSDFYREVNIRGYGMVQMNIMEQVGTDPRLSSLDTISNNSKNPNVTHIIEMQIAHIKNITGATLFESEYLLLYTDDEFRADLIIPETVECADKILDGGFSGFKILNSREILELKKEMTGVKYFDYTDAILGTYKGRGETHGDTFKIKAITFDSSGVMDLGIEEIKRIRDLASCVKRGSIQYGEWTIKDTIQGKVSRKEGEWQPMFDNIKDSIRTKIDKGQAGVNMDMDNEVFGALRKNKKKKEVEKMGDAVDGAYQEKSDNRENNIQHGSVNESLVADELTDDDEIIDF